MAFTQQARQGIPSCWPVFYPLSRKDLRKIEKNRKEKDRKDYKRKEKKKFAKIFIVSPLSL